MTSFFSLCRVIPIGAAFGSPAALNVETMVSIIRPSENPKSLSSTIASAPSGFAMDL